MQIRSTQEALYIACEMERGAVQLYERALILLKNQNREKEPLRAQLSYMLADEKQHLCQFTELYTGLDNEAERTLTLAAIASDILFPGGLMGAVRQGRTQYLQDQFLRGQLGLSRHAGMGGSRGANGYRQGSCHLSNAGVKGI